MKIKKSKLLSALVSGAFAFSAVSFTGSAFAGGKKEVTVNLETKGEAMMFNKTEITVPENSKVTLTLKNKSAALLHNWILVNKGTGDKVAMEGISLGEAKSFVKKSNKNVIAITPIVKPGKTAKVVFDAPKKGSYDFVCTSPGHNMIMKGIFVVK